MSDTPNVRLKDVAEQAGLAVSTVSMALNDHPSISTETKNKVLSASRQVGYRAPARRAGNHPTPQRVGFVVLGNAAQSAGYASLAFQVAAQATERDLRVEISSIPDISDPDAVLAQLLVAARDVNALLLSGTLPGRVGLGLLDAKVRALVIGQLWRDAESAELERRMHRVEFDNQAMGELATTHLLDRGDTRIGFAVENIFAGLSHDRFHDGYRLAHLRRGLTLDPDLEQIGVSMAAAAEHFARLEMPPTAYVIPNAQHAAGLLVELRARGIEPAPESLIIEDSAQISETFGLAHLPRVFGRPEELAAVALTLIQSDLSATPRLVLSVPSYSANL